jgi:hypothetical protein
VWETVQVPVAFLANRTALIIQDMWDRTENAETMRRVDALAPRLHAFVQAVRQKGVTVIHAPGGAVQPYEDTPARQRIQPLRREDMPSLEFVDSRYRYLAWLPRNPHDSERRDPDLADPPPPIRASVPRPDAGTADRGPRRQHPSIGINPESDCISDDHQEIWNLFRWRKIENVLLAGFLTGETVLSSPAGVKQMAGWGIHTVVLKDLTVTDCDPDQPPYVNYEEGKNILDGYLEKFWCLTALGGDILASRKNQSF